MLLSGTPPFYPRGGKNTLTSVKSGIFDFDDEYFAGVSDCAKDFICNCLTMRVNDRPTAKQALEHPWFRRVTTPKAAALAAESLLNNNDVAITVLQRLNNFVKHSSLANIIMDVIAHTLVPEQIADLRDQFSKLDVHNSGDISFNDLRNLLEKYPGFCEEDANVIFSHLDIDQKGKIGYHEFIAATVTRKHITDENLQIAFERMSNHAPYITSDDIKSLLGNTNHNISDIMEEVGLTLESKITFDEVR